MTVKWGCKLIKNCTLNEFITKYCSGELINFGCKIHNKENMPNKFIKYCTDCKTDLCEECLNTKDYIIMTRENIRHMKHMI